MQAELAKRQWEAYVFFASSFLRDARCVAANGLSSFNVSSWSDEGSFQQTVTPMVYGLDDHPATGLHSTAYFAVGHAIELFLKAFLLARGVSETELKNVVGHDLKEAINRARQTGLHFAFSNELAAFSDYHNKGLFRYPQGKREKAPPIDDLIMAATNLELVVKRKLWPSGNLNLDLPG